jgi:hypothetical protein
VRFPFDYDPALSTKTIVAESYQLQGALQVSVQNRQVLISGFYTMTVTGTITIRLWGIINPNKVDIQSTGAFGLALMSGTTALEGDFQIQGLIPLLAPGKKMIFFNFSR